MADDIYHTRVAYRDNDAWTSERGASKFLDQLIASTKQTKYQGEGCVINGFKVTPGSGMSVKINDNNGADGHVMIKYNSYSFLGWITAAYTLPISGSDQALPRRTVIVAYIDLSVEFNKEDNIIESPDVLKFKAVDGVPNSNPSDPSVSTIQSAIGLNNPYVVLASVYVPNGASSIQTGNITDLTADLKAKLSSYVSLDPNNTYVTGVLQAAPNNGVKTRIVITGPTAATPAAIPGVELIWLRRRR